MTSGSMTKAELVEEVSRVSDLTKKHSEVIVDTVFKSIIDALHRGEKIELRGFGSFRLRKREPRKGRNPKTGDKVDVPLRDNHHVAVVVRIEIQDDVAERAAKQDETLIEAARLAEDTALSIGIRTGGARHVGQSPGRPEAVHSRKG